MHKRIVQRCIYIASQYHRYNQVIQDTLLKSSNPHSTHNFVVLFVCVLMDALPGIVDGARKTSQSGSWVICARALGRSRRFPLLPMLEATTSTASRDQCINAVTSIAHHGVTGSSAVGTAQQLSGSNLRLGLPDSHSHSHFLF